MAGALKTAEVPLDADALADRVVSEAESTVVAAARTCMQRLGRSRVTMDDVCVEAGISRATLYRLFPGGREVLFGAVRESSLHEFFDGIRSEVDGADSLEELLVRVIVAASRALRDDVHLAVSLATEPGIALGDLTFEGVDRIIRVAFRFVEPYAAAYIPAARTEEIIDILARLVISYHLSPSRVFDFTDRRSVARFVRLHLLDNTHKPTEQGEQRP